MGRFCVCVEQNFDFQSKASCVFFQQWKASTYFSEITKGTVNRSVSFVTFGTFYEGPLTNCLFYLSGIIDQRSVQSSHLYIESMHIVVRLLTVRTRLRCTYIS